MGQTHLTPHFLVRQAWGVGLRDRVRGGLGVRRGDLTLIVLCQEPLRDPKAPWWDGMCHLVELLGPCLPVEDLAGQGSGRESHRVADRHVPSTSLPKILSGFVLSLSGGTGSSIWDSDSSHFLFL